MNLSKRISRVLVNLLVIFCLVIAGVSNTVASSSAQEAPTNTPSNIRFDKKDTQKVAEFSRREKRLEPVVSLQSTETQALTAGAYNVQPILFVPSDYSEDSNNVQAINTTFQTLRSWYSGALEQNNSAYTFNVSHVIVYKAAQPFSFYKCIDHASSCDNYDGVWGNIQTELINAGYPLWTAGYSHVIMVKGAGGWAGSSCTPNCYTNWPNPGPASTSGISILGDWAIDGITGNPNADCVATLGTACNLDPQRGAIGHELGHTFGLAHALDQEGSIMSSWWLFPYVSLHGFSGNDEKAVLRGSSFFTASACTYSSSLTSLSQPSFVKTGSQFVSNFTILNDGLCKWSANSTSLSLIRDNVWGLTSKVLTSNVYPAQSTSFSLALKAPTLPKSKLPSVKNSLWQMKMGKKLFGPIFGSAITVTQ